MGVLRTELWTTARNEKVASLGGVLTECPWLVRLSCRPCIGWSVHLLCAVSPEALRLRFFLRNLALRVLGFALRALAFFDNLRLVMRRRKVLTPEGSSKGESHTCGSNHLRLRL